MVGLASLGGGFLLEAAGFGEFRGGAGLVTARAQGQAEIVMRERIRGINANRLFVLREGAIEIVF